MLILEQPQFDYALPSPTQKLSDGFLRALPAPVGLWMPSKLALAAADFTPLPQKHFGTLNGGITTSASGFGVLGNSWKFNGTNGNINCGNSSALNPTGNWSITVVFSCPSPSTTQMLVNRDDTTHRSYSLNINTSQIQLQINGGSAFFSGATLAANTWYVLTIAGYLGVNYTAYLNGVNIGTTGWVVPNVTTINTVIGFREDGAFFFGGNIAYVSIASGAPTAGQVSALYQSLRTGKPFQLLQPDNLILDEIIGNTLLNLTSKATSQSFANGNEAVNRKLSSQATSQSFANGNEAITRAISSQATSQSFANGNEAVNRKLSSQATSQSFANGNEAVNRKLSSQATSQSFSHGLFTTQPIIVSSPPGAISQSFAHGAFVVTKGLASKAIAASYSEARISILRPLTGKAVLQSYAEGSIYLTKSIVSSSIAVSQSYAQGAITVNRQLQSEMISISHAQGVIANKLNLGSKAISQSSARAELINKLLGLHSEFVSQSVATGTNVYYGNKFVELTSVRTVSQDVENLGPIDNVAQELIRLRETSQQQIVGGGDITDSGQ